MAWRTAKINVVMRFSFAVYDVDGDAVTGLVNGGFTKLLAKDGVNSAVTVTVTELDAVNLPGIYQATFTPNAIGHWHLRVRHATYNKLGWATDAQAIYNDLGDIFLTNEEFTFMDSVEVDSDSLQLTSSRIRIFDTKAHADAATDGGVSETGTLATFIVTAVMASDGSVETYKRVRDDTQG